MSLTVRLPAAKLARFRIEGEQPGGGDFEEP